VNWPSGAELEYITIDGMMYVLDYGSGFTSAEKGSFLGIVSNGRDKGTSE